MPMPSFSGKSDPTDSLNPLNGTDESVNNWFEKAEFLGSWAVKPDNSINRKAFANHYFSKRERWDKAFAFLGSEGLVALETGRYELDGDNVFVMISEYNTIDPGDAKYEAHRKYIDIQYLIRGSELIGIAPYETIDAILQPYDPNREVEFFTVKGGEMKLANPGNFFIFFPSDAHMPQVKDVESAMVRKAVVKLKFD